MYKTIAITNQKGGVGKTTTAVNLSAALAQLGKKVLLIDFDPQGNATVSCGLIKNELQQTVCEVMLDGVPIRDAIVPAPNGGFDVLPSTIDLTEAEVGLLDTALKDRTLHAVLQSVIGDYDVVFIDCPPSLNMLTVNAMLAADGVLIPVQCEYFALEGIASLVSTLEQIRDRKRQIGGNERIGLVGVLRTMSDRRNRLSNDVSNELMSVFGADVLQTIIPRAVRLAEAPSYGTSIFQYEQNSVGAMAYLALANEIVRKKLIH